MEYSNEKYFTISNQTHIPAPGFGTYLIDNETVCQVVKEALDAGYRHIDTAAFYKNEEGVGKAIAESGLNRKDLFVVSKVWNDHRGYDLVKQSCQESLERLGLDYLDLFLIHWPANPVEYPDTWSQINQDSWKAMIDLYKEGKVKAIGVCNFLPEQLDPLMKMEIVPMVNQIEFHPGCTWPETLDYCKKHGILVEAWSPLGRGRVLEEPLLRIIAKDHGKDVAQVCVRYALQKNTLPLVKSVHPERIQSNLDVSDFELTPNEMEAIDELEGRYPASRDPLTTAFK